MSEIGSERIVFPRCEAVQPGVIEWFDGDPWPTYCTECVSCGYVITESEWQVAT